MIFNLWACKSVQEHSKNVKVLLFLHSDVGTYPRITSVAKQ